MPENTTLVTVVSKKEGERERENRRPVPGRQCGTQSGIFVALTSRWCV